MLLVRSFSRAFVSHQQQSSGCQIGESLEELSQHDHAARDKRDDEVDDDIQKIHQECGYKNPLLRDLPARTHSVVQLYDKSRAKVWMSYASVSLDALRPGNDLARLY